MTVRRFPSFLSSSPEHRLIRYRRRIYDAAGQVRGQSEISGLGFQLIATDNGLPKTLVEVHWLEQLGCPFPEHSSF
jgi:hypothetical protein